MNTVVDILGNEVRVGDTVATVKRRGSGAWFSIRVIKKIDLTGQVWHIDVNNPRSRLTNNLNFIKVHRDEQGT